MSGSDGCMPSANAIPEYFIESLISNYFAVLSLAYFGLPGLPSSLENINLEYFENAGHVIFASRDGGIYHSFGKFWCKLGGDSKSNEDAKKESMIKLLEFLKLTLGNCY